MSKRFRLFYTKKPIFFLFYTITFTKHSHQFIYYTHFFIKIVFFLTFLIISHLPHLTLLFSLNTPAFPSSSSCTYLYLHLSFFSFFFLESFSFLCFFLQFGFYTFIIDDDFGLGLIKGSGRRKQNFGWRKWWFWHLLLSFFFFSFFFFQFRFDYLYKFVYGFDEFGSRFRKILMILRCVRVIVVVVGGTVLQLVAELGFDFRGGKIYN